MRKASKILLIGAAAMSLLLGSSIGSAASSVSLSDGYAKTIEPILTRTSLAVQETDQLKAGNVKSLTFSAAAGFITAAITAEGALPRTEADVPPLCGTPAGNPTCRVPAPYGGVHLLAMFQTDLFEQDQIIGTGTSGGNLTWGPPGFNADGFRWFLYYGLVANRGDIECGLGYYDPTGQIVPPIPAGFGQTFFVVGQNDGLPGNVPPVSCSLSNGDKTVTIRIPYTWRWHDTVNPNLSVKVAEAGKPIRNISAFSWMDHEIGGPDPVGLILGWTWYTDALPRASYKVGVIAGDPNPAVFAGPKCLTNFFGGAPAPGFETPGPCAIPNPVGTGFTNTGTNITAG